MRLLTPVVITATILTLAASCAGSAGSADNDTIEPQTPTKEIPVASGPECPSADDPTVEYYGTGADDDECRGMVLNCSKGYGFRNECGCGCAQEDPLPPDHEPRACETNDDCGLSCRRIGSCCDQLCTCDLPYSKRTIELLDGWHAERCGDTICPVASCEPESGAYVAVCTNGRCEKAAR